MATANDTRPAKIEGAGDWGMKVAKSGHGVDEEDRYLIFNSKRPCLKILQLDKAPANNVTETVIPFISVVAFPLVILVFLYDSATGKYEPVNPEYDADNLYLAPGGKASGSYYYYYIGYA